MKLFQTVTFDFENNRVNLVSDAVPDCMLKTKSALDWLEELLYLHEVKY